jgi:hypothetical protein
MESNELILAQLPADIPGEIREGARLLLEEVDEQFRIIDREVEEIANLHELDEFLAEVDGVDADVDRVFAEIDEQLDEFSVSSFDESLRDQLDELDGLEDDFPDGAEEDNRTLVDVTPTAPDLPNNAHHVSSICDLTNSSTLSALSILGYLKLPGFPSKKRRRARDFFTRPFRKAHQPLRKPRLRLGVDLFSDLVRRREHLSFYKLRSSRIP